MITVREVEKNAGQPGLGRLLDAEETTSTPPGARTAAWRALGRLQGAQVVLHVGDVGLQSLGVSPGADGSQALGSANTALWLPQKGDALPWASGDHGLVPDLLWDDVREWFEPDGSLLDVYVFDTTVADWQAFVDLVRSVPSAPSAPVSAYQISAPKPDFGMAAVEWIPDGRAAFSGLGVGAWRVVPLPRKRNGSAKTRTAPRPAWPLGKLGWHAAVGRR